MTEQKFKVNGRIWMELDGEKVLGPGRVELLERVQSSGSLRQAALQMKMSYKQAWDMINHLNIHIGSPVVISHRGGKGGGNAEVTDQGKHLIRAYHRLQEKFQQFLEVSSNDASLSITAKDEE
jgi:molybdate transport system regulatory protein